MKKRRDRHSFNIEHSTLDIQHSPFVSPMPSANVDFSPVAVTFQAIGTLLLALVLGQIARTLPRPRASA
jgi:biotin transporter BioY